MTTLTKAEPYTRENLFFASWSLERLLNHYSNLLLTIFLLYFSTGLLSAIWGVCAMCVHCASSLGHGSFLHKYTYSPHGLHCTPQVTPAWHYSKLPLIHQGWYKPLLPWEGTIMPFLICRSLVCTSIYIIFWGAGRGHHCCVDTDKGKTDILFSFWVAQRFVTQKSAKRKVKFITLSWGLTGANSAHTYWAFPSLFENRGFLPRNGVHPAMPRWDFCLSKPMDHARCTPDNNF